ncbi:transglycosylase family protein [Streptomyces sp. SAJ15]|uniref:LysM peptidoglycan-binding domain-containing protein n=1 Tax=Streptomyces sp. SAJ15 TaxID=2011095 RepID=UPI0011849363|nr:transglycosylase family protein [Streptomyces sp. SAJ15]TVL88131.1 transglycosylase [Streptomyces sp. SAJ15]
MLHGKGKHRRPSKVTRIATLAGVAGAAVAVPLMGASAANAATTEQWDQVAQCESGGNWSINTGNGYYGGLQFSASTWAAYGGTQYAPTADKASKSQQIEIAQKVLAGQGKGAWPKCGVNLTSGGQGSGSGGSQAHTPSQNQTHTQSQSQSQSRPQTHQQSQPQARPTAQPQPERTTQAPKANRSQERQAQPQQSAPRHAAPKTIQKGDGEYQVRAGDTLSTIAAAQHVDGGWQKLYELNDDIVGDADLIYPGQMLDLR